MIIVKPFKGFRPSAKMAETLSSRPYDVLSSSEARQEAAGNPYSFYRIIKPEVDFDPDCDEHDPRVYDRAVVNFRTFLENGWLRQDPKPCYYLYAQTMAGRTQYGLVVGAAVADYLSGAIKKHELTRADKEEDRKKHVRNTCANMEPVFLAYRDSEALARVMLQAMSQSRPVYDFISNEGFEHRLWVIDDDKLIADVTAGFAELSALYIADGHHRTAAAALVGAEMAAADPHHTGNEEYNYFMAVCFPASQLRIMDYNRVVRDLNGLSEEQFLEALRAHFDVAEAGSDEPYRPVALHNFSLYLGGRWYSLTAHPDTYDDNDPIGGLDVTVSSRFILDEILGIKDLRRDQRVDFVGGLRGLVELKRRVDSGEMKAALALYPVSMEQLMTIADTGNIMPPKTTWFEPKLRSGLVVHTLSD